MENRYTYIQIIAHSVNELALCHIIYALIVVRFLAFVTTMVTKVDHDNHGSNDCVNDRSNHRSYYDGYYNGNT